MDPYPGLRPFEARDSQFFFGRQSQIKRVLDRLGSGLRMVFIVGPSGCGKSSLIRAGVIPRLTAFGLPRQGYVWVVATCTPGRQPLANLTAALSSVIRVPPEHSAVGAVSDFLKEGQSLGSFVEYFRNVLDVDDATSGDRKFSDEEVAARRKEANLLILVDQFEEILATDGPPSQEATSFVELMASTIKRAGSGRVFLAITMRTENLRELATFPELPSLLNEAQFYITAPDEAEFEQIIVRPARRFLQRGQGEGVSVNRNDLNKRGYPFTSELLDMLLKQVAELRHDPDHLPLLQHLLRALWLNRGANGGIGIDHLQYVLGREDLKYDPQREPPGWVLREALNVYAEKNVYQQRCPDHALTDIFLRLLVDRGEGGVMTRRRTTPEEVLQVAGHDHSDREPESLGKTVEAFKSPHPLVRDEEGSLDVAHEALLRNWERFRRASEDEQRAADALRHVVERYEEWRKSGESGGLLDAQDLERWKEWRDRGDNVPWHSRYDEVLAPVGIDDGSRGSGTAGLRLPLDTAVGRLREYWDRSKAEVARRLSRERTRSRLLAFGIGTATALAVTLIVLFILYKNSLIREELAGFDSAAVNITAAALELSQQAPNRHVQEEDGYRLKEAVALSKVTKTLRDLYDHRKRDSWFRLWFGSWVFPDQWDTRIETAITAADRTVYDAIKTGLSSRISWPPSGDWLPDLRDPKADINIPCDYNKKKFIILGQRKMSGIDDHMKDGYMRIVAKEASEETPKDVSEQTLNQLFFGWYRPPGQGSAAPIQCHFSVSGTIPLPLGKSRVTVDSALEAAVIQYPAAPAQAGASSDSTPTVHNFYRIDWVPSCDSDGSGKSCTPGLAPAVDPVNTTPLAEGSKDYMPILGRWYNLKWTLKDPTLARQEPICRPRPKLLINPSQPLPNKPDCLWNLSAHSGRQVSLSRVVGAYDLVQYTVKLSRVLSEVRGKKSQEQTVVELTFLGPEADEIELDSDYSIDFKLKGDLGYERFSWTIDRFQELACDGSIPMPSKNGVEPLPNYIELRETVRGRFTTLTELLDSEDPCGRPHPLTGGSLDYANWQRQP